MSAVSQEIVPSPCISLCQMDEATSWCKGCFRTIEEIIAWGQAGNEYKLSVLEQLDSREAAYARTEL